MKKDNQKPAPMKNTSLYFQLGLIASLFMVYFVLELETEKRTFEDDFNRVIPNELTQVDFDHRIQIEVQPKKVETVKMKPLEIPQPTEQFEITKNDIPAPEDAHKIRFIEPEIENSIYDVPKIKNTPNVYELNALDRKPTFMVCANLEGEARENCFKEQLAYFFRRNLNYPSFAQNSGIQGTVLVEFIVSNEGVIKGVKPLRKAVSPDLEKEALRAVSRLPKMSPGVSNGKSVDVRFVLPVSFKLNP
jgi:protein TonB